MKRPDLLVHAGLLIVRMEDGAICLPRIDVLKMKLVISVRCLHLDVKGGGNLNFLCVVLP